MMSKKLNIVVFILFVGLLSSCSIYKQVDIGGVNNVDFKGMVDNKVKLQLKVPIENPNAYKLKIKDMDLDVHINGKYLGKMKNSKEIVVEKKSNQVQDFPVEIHVKNMLGSMGLFYKLRKSSSVEMKIEGTIKVKAVMRTKTIKVSEVQNISL